MEIIMELAMTSRSISVKSLWSGRIISAIAVLFLLFDSITKIVQAPFVMKASAQFGYSTGIIPVIGIILLVCVVIYVIPRTTILGAILLTGYLGGAVEVNIRIGAPLFSNVLFPVYFGILVWSGLYLRNQNLRRFIPLFKND